MLLRQIFDPQLAQYAYLIGCQRSGEAIIIDPERDIDQYIRLARENGLLITAVAETHIHADFVSGAREFAQDAGVLLYLSNEGGAEWSYTWAAGRSNTHLLKDGDTFTVGNIALTALHTPGHTPEHMSYLVTDRGSGANEPIALITGDFLFMGDVGRPDLLESAAGVQNVMEPSARTLQHSLSTRLSDLGDYVQILPGHGAGSACGKALGAVPTTTLGYERRFNGALKLALQDSASFVEEILHGQPDPPLYFATMKRVNRDGVDVTGGVPPLKRLAAHEIAELVKRSQGITILDTRDNTHDFHSAHSKGAILAPLHSPHFSMSAGSFLSEHEQFLLLVESPSDVDRASRQLYRIGLDGACGWTLMSDLKEAGVESEQTEVCSAEDFQKVVSDPEVQVIDVRTSSEFQEAHIDGALSIPYTRLRERLSEVPTGKRLVIHCASGRRAALATSFLAARGYDTVLLDGDFPTLCKHSKICSRVS